MGSDNGVGHKRQVAVILWVAAFVLTTAAAVIQRITGPTFPVFGSSNLGGSEIVYRFDRSHGGQSDASVTVHVGAGPMTAVLEWRPEKSQEAWSTIPMKRDKEDFTASVPYQPPATKICYRVRMLNNHGTLVVPGEEGVVLRFKGEVPMPILVAHIILMFTAMFFSTRAGLEWFKPQSSLKILIVLTTILLAVGGLLLGPIVQKYAFGAFWTGWPVGKDLTDNKTAIAFLAWVIVWIAHSRVKKPQTWALVAAAVTLAVFLIPHSILGSEREYKAGEKAPLHDVLER